MKKHLRMPKIYRWIERTLMPTDYAVRVVLAAIALISILMIIQPSRSLRVLWAAYMVAP